MIYYAVIDTNVLVSALLSKFNDTATALILKYILDGTIVPMLNMEILSEYEDVLHRRKFGITYGQVEDVLQIMQSTGITTNRVRTDAAFTDRNDIVFYEVAMSRDDSYLITGNLKHFPKVDRVVSPAQMVEIITTGNEQ